MEIFQHLALGFDVVLSPTNLLFCFIGALLGTLIGVLPGLGPVTTIAMLLPISFTLPPVSSLIMLSGIYYGASYGGSTTAILVNLPGETNAVVTCIDGYQMARKGRAGAALAIAALGSFFAGSVATMVIAIASPPLSTLALRFGAAEYCSLMVLGLVGAIVLAQGSLIKALAMACLGLLFGLVGTDVSSAQQRFTFGMVELADGLQFVAVAVGVFGVTEIVSNLIKGSERSAPVATVGRLMPSREEFRRAVPASLRGTIVGSLLGVLPGGGSVLASFTSYALEKRLAKDPQRFGTGAVEGVAGPESANNAGAQTSFIPMLTLGIPSNGVMALMIGALMIQGITPGPQVMTKQPELFWGLIASMWVGNLMLVILNLPLIGIWIKLLRIPYRLLFPVILILCCIGVYSVDNSTFAVGLAALFATLGYVWHKLGCEPVPFLLGFILGPLLEENLRRALALSDGDLSVFVQRPISLGLLIASAILIVLITLPSIRVAREDVFREV